MQVLEAKAVLHGRLSIAEIGGAGRPVPSREENTVRQHNLQTLHRTELHTRSDPTSQPSTLKYSPGGHSAWTYFVCSQNSHWRVAEGGCWCVTVSCACQDKKYSVKTRGYWFPKLGIHSFIRCSFHSEGFCFKTTIEPKSNEKSYIEINLSRNYFIMDKVLKLTPFLCAWHSHKVIRDEENEKSTLKT